MQCDTINETSNAKLTGCGAIRVGAGEPMN